MAARADARDLWGFAQELHRAARTIADIDAFHLLVYHAHEDAPMHYVLFANTETTWPGARHPTPPGFLDDGDPPAAQTSPYPIGVGDFLALKHSRTITEIALPLPYGDAFNLFPSQLYIPILHETEPLGVLCVMAGIHNFFPPELRQAYENLAHQSAPLLSHCLRPEPIEPTSV
jgi:hypothetical protein